MLLDLFTVGELERLRQIEADVLGLPTLLVHPLLHRLLVLYDSNLRLENIEWHSRKPLGVQLAELVLIIMIIRRAEDDSAQSALRDKRVSPLRRINLRPLSLIESREVPIQRVTDRLVFGQPKRVVQRTQVKRLDNGAVRLLLGAERDL